MGYRIIGSIVLLLLMLLGCAPQMAWEKPGATQSEFAEARYACLQQSQERVSTASTNQFGHDARNSIITNQPLFDACMTSQGWSSEKQVSQEEQETIKEVQKRFAPQFAALCTRPDLQIHYRKTSCNPEDATLEQLADTSRISGPEKVALANFRAARDAINKQFEDAIRQTNPQAASWLIRGFEMQQAQGDRLLLEFYEGRTTRGEYNKARRDLSLHYHDWSST
jgi:hypothetical protein